MLTNVNVYVIFLWKDSLLYINSTTETEKLILNTRVILKIPFVEILMLENKC